MCKGVQKRVGWRGIKSEDHEDCLFRKMNKRINLTERLINKALLFKKCILRYRHATLGETAV